MAMWLPSMILTWHSMRSHDSHVLAVGVKGGTIILIIIIRGFRGGWRTRAGPGTLHGQKLLGAMVLAVRAQGAAQESIGRGREAEVLVSGATEISMHMTGVGPPMRGCTVSKMGVTVIVPFEHVLWGPPPFPGFGTLRLPNHVLGVGKPHHRRDA